MTRLPLSRTWEELAAIVSRRSSPLDIVELLNLVRPRNWTFRISFDERSRNVLQISADPPLTEGELFQLADGTVAALFNCDELTLAAPSAVLRADLRANLAEPPRTNLLDLERCDQRGDPGIRLVGFHGKRLAAEASDKRAIGTWLRERTWFGSRARVRPYKTVHWQCMASYFEFTQSKDWIDEVCAGHPSFECEAAIEVGSRHAGRVFVALAPANADAHFHHSRFGRLDPKRIDRRFWIGLATPDLGCLVELEEPSLIVGFDREMGPFTRAQEVLQAAKNSVMSVLSSDDCRAFMAAEERRRLEQSAAHLRQRQENALLRARVVWAGKDLMCVPRGEQEVVYLLGKLEALGALPLSSFCLREYTPKSGIDALVDYQVDSTGQSVKLGPVELEHSFLNFFAHEHPLQQVGMIICWDRGIEEEDGRLRFVRPGLFRFTDGENSAWLLVLSEISGLEVV